MAESTADQLSYNPLLSRFFLTPEQKASKEKGKSIVKTFYSQSTSDATNLNFFKARNARQIQLLLWAKGSQNTTEFLDYMSISDGNKAWINLDLTPTRIAPQFVGTLVESMAKNKTYPCVKAIDDGSISEKEQRMMDALYRMKEVATINDMQQQAGIQLEPSDVYVPDDEISARVYFELEDRLPKEIRFEEMLNDLQNEIKFERILNRKTIYDLTVLNCSATKIEKLANKKYTVKKCVPSNMVYNFFMNDSGDLEIDMIGEFYNLKVKDYRSKFGKSASNPDGLTEKEIFELAKLSTNKNIGTFNYMWNDNWALTTYNQNRPYDDCSILIFDCEINFEEEEYYVSKKDSFGKENIKVKKNVPYQQKTKDGKIIEQQKPDDTEIIKSKKNTWMRGVYAPYGDKMLYWGRPDIIITPYTNVAKPLSSYTINVPFNDGEYVPSLFERIIEPLKEYQLVKLKRKQLIAQIRPAGIRIDVESARNIDLGNGDTIAWEEVLRIYNQTGTEIWSSRGIDPLQKESPSITNTAVDDSVRKIMELTNVLAGIVNEIRSLIGVPMYRDGSDVGDRTSGVLQEQQSAASYNVTDFILNANNQLWEETFYKVCLLHWNDIVKEEPESKDDMINTRFQVGIKMKATEYEKGLLEADIQRYSQMPDAEGNPSLTLKDAMMIRSIEDPKLARWYLTKTYEENRRRAEMDKSKAIQENQQAQQASLQQAAQNEKEAQAAKIASEKEIKEFESQKEKEIKLLEGVLNIAAKGLSIPPEFQSLIQLLVPNIAIPLAQENKQMTEAIVAQQQDEAAHAFAQSQMQQEGQEGMQGEQMEDQLGMQEQPQQEMAEQQLM